MFNWIFMKGQAILAKINAAILLGASSELTENETTSIVRDTISVNSITESMKNNDGSDFSGVSEAAQNLGGGVYSVLFTILIIGAVLALMFAAIKIIFGGSQGHAESKSNLVWIVVAVALGVCATGIIAAIAGGAAGLFG